MADKAALERVIREIYDARIRGDVDGILRHTAESVEFSIAGCGASSAIPCSVTGQAPLRDLMRHLISAFEFRNGRILDLMIDGDRAIVHWRVHVKAPASGEEAHTELVDLIRFSGEKVLSFRQFADTALASRLLAPTRQAAAEAG
ncbi:nuclear transport factor 2 family protein [Enterovirga aerilata]|uniref:Nuclear transport factor 2 family protein n=1 Tax=Enterovirga aerilata TaxID=2730920 RepID=A0A849I6P4_9HYPH|nr:nuclear transport factor 2 family protein [Enterovirga sp. DB1703]NNM71760.1 nuclear transport factor 2 family protein [Enterovirga sp. DB1703]